jgi:hypothetical protein
MKKIISLCLVLLCVACSSPSVPLFEKAKPSPNLGFIDIEKFDRDLAASFEEPLNSVDVIFYDKTSPNAIPPRMQKWISATEKTGGKITIEPPPNDLVPRNPVALFGLFGSLFSGAKFALDMRADLRLEKSKGHDAVIYLERNSQGEVVVAKIKFTKQSKL